MRIHLMVAALAAALAVPALAQTPAAAPPAPPPLTPLPAPALDDNAPPRAFIEAAMHAIAAGNTGEAQEAIERAESRLLTRSVKPSQARTPDQKPLIQQLADARHALASGDRMGAITILQNAEKSPEANQKAE